MPPCPSNHLGNEGNELVNKITLSIVISNVTTTPCWKQIEFLCGYTDGFKAIAKGTFLILKIRNCVIVDYYNNSDLTAHTWSPHYTRLISVYSPPTSYYSTISAEIIVTALRDLGFSIINVLNVRHRVSKGVLPIFIIVLDPNQFNLSILSYLLNSKIVVEKPHHGHF